MCIRDTHPAQFCDLDFALFSPADGGAHGTGDHLLRPKRFRIFFLILDAVLQAEHGREPADIRLQCFDDIFGIESLDRRDDQIDIIMAGKSFISASIGIETLQVMLFSADILDPDSVCFQRIHKPRLFHIDQRIADQRKGSCDIGSDRSRSKT